MTPKFKIGETVKLNKSKRDTPYLYKNETGAIQDIRELFNVNLIQYFVSDGSDNAWFYEDEIERIK